MKFVMAGLHVSFKKASMFCFRAVTRNLEGEVEDRCNQLHAQTTICPHLICGTNLFTDEGEMTSDVQLKR